MKGKKIKINVLLKHVDLIIESLANMPKNKPAIYMQILITAAFLSFIHDAGLVLEPFKEAE